MVGLCRLCASLKKADLLINIKDQSNEVCQRLQKCCQVTILMNDCMPKSVCQLCLDQLNVSYNFYAKVQEAQDTLKTLFPNKHQTDENTEDVDSSENDSLPKDSPAPYTAKQRTSMESVEMIESPSSQKKSLRKIKNEREDAETQRTLKALYPCEKGNNKRNDIEAVGEPIIDKDSIPDTSKTLAKLENKEDVKRQKKSSSKVKLEKADVEHSKQEESNIEFTSTQAVSETEDVHNDDSNDGDNDGYLQEVYSILGMSHVDVGADQGPTAEEHERMDSLVTTFDKEEQNHLIIQEDHFFLDDEDEQNFVVDENLLDEEQQSVKILQISDGNVEIEEFVYDEKYPDEEIVMNFEKLEEDTGQNTNEDTDGVAGEDIKTYYSTLPLAMQLSSWKSYKHHCYACYYKASSFDDLTKHCHEFHFISDMKKLHYKCSDCHIVIEHYSDFLNHVRRKHHPALKLRCDACDMLCKDYQQYELHRDFKCLEARVFPKILSCPYCSKTFRSFAGKVAHIRKHMDGNPTLYFDCKHCPKKYVTKTALDLHEEISHESKIATFPCDHCDMSFTDKGSYEVHFSTHVNRILYRCHICQKEFKTQSYLEKHQFIHTDQRPFTCSFCPRQFRTRIEQTTHERVHTGEMPLQCSNCEKRFRFRSALAAHLKTHSGIRAYTCKYCSRQFKDISNFKKHIRRKHAAEESNDVVGDVK